MANEQFTEVSMFFDDCRIDGKIYTWGDYAAARLTDVINDGNKFVSVVDAKTYSHETGNVEPRLLYEEPHMIINMDYVKRIVLKKKENIGS